MDFEECSLSFELEFAEKLKILEEKQHNIEFCQQLILDAFEEKFLAKYASNEGTENETIEKNDDVGMGTSQGSQNQVEKSCVLNFLTEHYHLSFK